MSCSKTLMEFQTPGLSGRSMKWHCNSAKRTETSNFQDGKEVIFETVIMESYKRREISVEQAMIAKYPLEPGGRYH